MEKWKNIIKFKLNKDVQTRYQNGIITLIDDDIVWFNVKEKTTGRTRTALSEDLRDFLRRNGIKIYTDNHFKSIEKQYNTTIITEDTLSEIFKSK